MSVEPCDSDATWASLLSAATASSSRRVGMRREKTADASASEVEICDESTIPPKRWVAAITPSATCCTSLREVESASAVVRSILRPATGRGAVAPALDWRWNGAASSVELSAGALFAATPEGEDVVVESPPLFTSTIATTMAATAPAAGE